MMGEAYPDEGFCMGLSRQSWCDFGVRKQLSLGINFGQDNRGGTSKARNGQEIYSESSQTTS